MKSPHEEKINILIVDDRPDGLLTLEAVLSSPDYNLVKATSGRDALAKLPENEFALILLDVQMPDLDGFQTATILKQNPKFKDIPIIFVTAISKEEKFVYLGYDVGAVDYLFKPFDPHVLKCKVAVLVDLFRKNLKIKEQTELIRESELKERERQVKLKAAQARSEFFSSMSHDIRTPMNCIVGMADLLAHTKLTEEQANYVGMLNKSSDHLLQLVNSILDLSKLESGRFEIENRQFDLLETIESVLDITSSRAHSKGLELVLHVQPEVPRYVMGDEHRLRQVLMNLLGNAVKFTNSGEIVLSLSHESETVLFSIKDTGIGIPQEKMSKVFDHFTQLNSDPSAPREGSGLGLSICKRLSDLMGATLTVQSVLGKGSTFSFKVPLVQAEMPSKSLSPLNLKEKTILIVDDNPAVCLILSELLRSWGAKVQAAFNGEQATRLIQSAIDGKKNFDLILADIRMPGTQSGGLDVLSKLRDELGGLKRVVMMLPTNHRHGDLERIRNAGVGYYVIKPVKHFELSQAVAKVLELALPEKNISLLQVDGKKASKPLRLLVVDDSQDNRYLIEAYFRDTGFQLEIAENGLEAIEKFKSGKFDLVLMDLQMPVMDGFASLKSIRNWEKSVGQSKTPIIALTASALKEEAERCLAAGFKAHVTKPIRKRNLIEVVLSNVA